MVVPHGATRTVVAGTPTDSDASVSYTPSDDSTSSGHQVDLDVGSTRINVTVTAEDGNTTKTYTVTVTRAAAEALPAVPSDETALQTFEFVTGERGSALGYDRSLRYGTLTPTTFQFNDTTYTIDYITNNPASGALNLGLSPLPTATEAAGLKLYVGASIKLEFSTASRSSTAFAWTSTSNFGEYTTPLGRETV